MLSYICKLSARMRFVKMLRKIKLNLGVLTEGENNDTEVMAYRIIISFLHKSL